jgi:glycosyltransferase involved in cell wall biosynthesis
MACGTPVLTVKRSSIPEVVGDAAWLVEDPLDVSEFAQAMGMLLSDNTALTKLSIRGLARSRIFTWEQTAKRTMTLYHEVIDD